MSDLSCPNVLDGRSKCDDLICEYCHGKFVTFIFCPFCGTEYKSWYRYAPEEGHRCGKCGKSVYINNAVGCNGLLIERNSRNVYEALITQRGIEPRKGKWGLPGGFLQPLELPREAVIREFKEELGISVQPKRLQMSVTHTYGDIPCLALIYDIYWPRLKGPNGPEKQDLIPADDVSDYRWVSFRDLESCEFAYEHDKQAIREQFESLYLGH